MILRAIRLLEERPAARRRVSERYRAVLVDEYQDTNYAQQQLLRLLVADHRNVVVVGDDDQSIYRFRGASRKNIVDFQQTFPDAKVIRLETNYRSNQAILDAAHAVVEPSEERLPKKLRSGAQAARALGLDPVSFWRCENERAQAQAVAAELERLIADGVDPGRDRGAGALGAQRGTADGDGARGARHPLPAGRAARASSSAPRCATCSPGCACWPTRRTRARSCAR